ncbi:MAG: ComF family protein [Betaproteobacteria bacterium]|nr:ComF family protein [Betaproteobacteria bacterium]
MILNPELRMKNPVIVAMPLHRSRLVERGFNQALEIARHVASVTGGTLLAVEKHRQTRHQSELPLSERGANVRGAFRCLTSFAGTSVVVIDDVMTTGASLNELARILKLAGAAAVVNLVVARTLPLEEVPIRYRRQTP